MEISDLELIQRLQRGDVSAFDALFEKYRRGILAYLRGLLGQHARAEEITQDVFLELVRSIATVDAARGASAWLFRVARNRAYDQLRRRKFEAGMDDDSVLRLVDEQGEGAGETISAGLEQEDRARALDVALRQLDELEREILVMHYYGDLPFREIVRRPLGTVLWKSRRSLEKLNSIMGADHDV
ncbi:MAG: sigma-70 family RNA polymerase sigma factor [Verrucomicrobia bacterium]|nr:sigma-70 family RNA polymerase sigma factor [Verrucomicrobiota bacterium]